MNMVRGSKKTKCRAYNDTKVTEHTRQTTSAASKLERLAREQTQQDTWGGICFDVLTFSSISNK